MTSRGCVDAGAAASADPSGKHRHAGRSRMGSRRCRRPVRSHRRSVTDVGRSWSERMPRRRPGTCHTGQMTSCRRRDPRHRAPARAVPNRSVDGQPLASTDPHPPRRCAPRALWCHSPQRPGANAVCLLLELTGCAVHHVTHRDNWRTPAIRSRELKTPHSHVPDVRPWCFREPHSCCLPMLCRSKRPGPHTH